MPKRGLSFRAKLYARERDRTLRNRIFVLLRDELGLGRQPKVARLLADEIVDLVRSTLSEADLLRPGQLVLLATELGQGASWERRTLADKKMRRVQLTLVAPEDIDRLAAGATLARVRVDRMVRMIDEAYEQGAALTYAQLSLLTGISSSRLGLQLRNWAQKTGRILPTRGIVDDCSRATSHKALIVARHLRGQSTSEIARRTHHSRRSVERYLRRFEQIRQLIVYLDTLPEPAVIARILGCSEHLVRAYLDLLPPPERPGPAPGGPQTGP